MIALGHRQLDDGLSEFVTVAETEFFALRCCPFPYSKSVMYIAFDLKRSNMYSEETSIVIADSTMFVSLPRP